MSDELQKGLGIVLNAAVHQLYEQVAGLAEVPCANCGEVYPVADLRPMLLGGSSDEDELRVGLCCEKCRNLAKQ